MVRIYVQNITFSCSYLMGPPTHTAKKEETEALAQGEGRRVGKSRTDGLREHGGESGSVTQENRLRESKCH